MSDFIKDVLVPVSGVVTAVLAGWVSYSVSNVRSALDVQKLQLEEQQASLNRLATERNIQKIDEDLTFRIYDAVTASIKANDAKQQQAASALVIVMAAEPLRTQLLQVFDKSQTTVPEVKSQVAKVLETEQRFQQEENSVAASSAAKPPPPTAPPSPGSGGPAAAPAPQGRGGWGEWDIDVFACEQSGTSAQGQAAAIVSALKNEGARGRLRARVLPDSINARAGYRMRGFVIRRDPGEEERAAALQRLAQATLPGASFEITPSGSSTRWYLSAFVCP